MRYLGIDPGVSGGIAAVDSQGHLCYAEAMPENPRAIVRAIDRAIGMHAPRCVLEHVWSSPGWGHAGAFTFGRNFGSLEGVLAAAGVTYDLVVPRTWQPAMGVIIPPGTNSTDRKNIGKARAQELFPGVVCTHTISDALLLAEYCRRLCLGRLGDGCGREVNRARPDAGCGVDIVTDTGRSAGTAVHKGLIDSRGRSAVARSRTT
jgi:hypothetical protein